MRAERSRTQQVLIAWLPALGYMACIWTLSSLSSTPLPIQSVPFKDKGAHFLEYAVLAFLVAHAIRGTWPRLGLARGYLVALVMTVVWGMFDEIHQAYVPNRQSDIWDLFADGLGALVGAGLFTLLRLRRDSARLPE